MPLIDGVYFTDDEYREQFGDPGPDRPDFEARGYRDNYPDAVQDVPGHNYVTEPGHYANADSGGGDSDPYANLPAGVTRAMAEDFIRRNPGDYHRLASAWQGDNQGGPFDRQSDMYDQRTNQLSAKGISALAARQAPPLPAWSGAGGGFQGVPGFDAGGSYTGGSVGLSAITGQPRPYQPFTETYTPPAWTGGDFDFDPSTIRAQEGYQFRRDEGIRGIERTASARGKSFTPDTRQALVEWNSALASTELGHEFGRQLGTYQQKRGNFESDRDFSRGAYLDKAGIHDRNETGRYNTERTNLTDSWGRDDSMWTRGRLDRNDQWARGTDVWSMNRLDRNDVFDQNYRLSDLVLSRRPYPR